MALFSRDGRISAKPFATVLAIPEFELETIIRPDSSVSNVPARRGLREQDIPLTEGCFITKTVKYTHELVHWIKVARGTDSTDVEEFIESSLCIIPQGDFKLSDRCNLSFLEMYLHRSLDLYAFFAITPSLSTLDSLIAMVRDDNDRRQGFLDSTGIHRPRDLDFQSCGFTHPTYELVALHPNHLLPPGNVLTVYDHNADVFHYYVPAEDLHLRKTEEATSDRLPTIVLPTRIGFSAVNVFLVALNAEIKFRRFQSMHEPMPLPLPPDNLILVERTMELVNLLYWQLSGPTKGSLGEQLAPPERRNLTRQTPGSTAELRDNDVSTGDRKESSTSIGSRNVENKQRLHYPVDADLETRMAFGRSLMCGHDYDYDPELFEDAFPLEAG